MMSLFLSVLFPSLVTYPGNLHSFHNTPKARVHGYLLQTGPLPGCICTSTIFRKHLAVPPLHPPNTWKEDAGLSQPRSSALAVLCAPLARARNLVRSERQVSPGPALPLPRLRPQGIGAPGCCTISHPGLLGKSCSFLCLPGLPPRAGVTVSALSMSR